MDIGGLHVGIRHDWNSRVWSTWLTTKDTELGKSPTGALIMTEDQAVSHGSPRIIRRIFTDASHMEERMTISNREIDKLENKKAYFEDIVAISEFPESQKLEALQKERLSIVEIPEATSEEEDELVKDILSDDDPYPLGPDDLDEDASEEDDDDFRFVASASVDNLDTITSPFEPRLRV